MKEWNEQSENGEISDDFLVGRQDQLQYLLHLFPRMHTSKHARSFVILGEAGVGKTHLCHTFFRMVKYQAMRLLLHPASNPSRMNTFIRGRLLCSPSLIL